MKVMDNKLCTICQQRPSVGQIPAIPEARSRTFHEERFIDECVYCVSHTAVEYINLYYDLMEQLLPRSWLNHEDAEEDSNSEQDSDVGGEDQEDRTVPEVDTQPTQQCDTQSTQEGC